MTLPLIYALSKASYKDKKNMINIIKNHGENKKKVAEVLGFVTESGGIQYTRQKMQDHQDKAFELLNSFSDNPFKASLMHLVKYTTEREK
jgi:octaprenyl-diphosphate synthase